LEMPIRKAAKATTDQLDQVRSFITDAASLQG